MEIAQEFDTGGHPAPPKAFNMAQYVLHAGLTVPDKIALDILGQESWSYRDLTRAVLGTANGFLGSGLNAGDRILLRLGNTVDFPIAYLAALAVDLVPVPTSSQLTQAEITPMARKIAPKLILAGDGIALPDWDAPVLQADALRTLRQHPQAAYVMGDPDRLGYIIFTSGTSGTPHAVAHAHRAVWARQMMFRDWYGLTPNDRILHAGAVNWTYTLGTGLIDPWCVGATALIPPSGTASRDLVHLATQARSTLLAAAPGVYRQMLKSGLTPMPDLRHALSAGEKLPDQIAQSWAAATGTPLFEAFGMSECSTFLSCGPHHTGLRAQDGRRIALTTHGKIAVHYTDAGLMLGYYDKGALDLPLEGDWYVTSDTAIATGEGEFALQGRSDDMLNAGGYRVSPLELEDVALRHPNITEAAAVEVSISPDTTLIALFYVAEAEIPEADIKEFCSPHLAAYKHPRICVFQHTLPRNPNGKLMRKTLRTTFEAKANGHDHG